LSENTNKILKIWLIVAGITFVVGLIFYLLEIFVLGEYWFNYFFYDNTILFFIFSIITELGDTRAYIFLIVIVWYVYDKKFASKLAFSLLGSYYINSVLKDIFTDPRPPTNLRPLVTGNPTATGWGFPSGHSQQAVPTYGYLAHESYVKENKILFWVFAILFYVVASSRIIIGVHDVQDVWGGLTFGYICFILFLILEPKLTEKVESLSILVKLLLAVVVPILLYIIATLAFPGSELDWGLVTGALIGLGLGYTIEVEYIKYNPRELNNKQRIINLVIGIVITLVLYLGLSALFPESSLMDLFQYLILSFILVTLVPWIFTKINK
jgi:membrane-associated phospholipid phosphatase